ncbi:ABC transporter permease [[Clostridium] dakarense]|uniref:ABC transporter permease n=1 Tax=Faecalimicrobium dakarense TaxID=1301100 RepID=UPI0004B0F8AB|nr:ABC transporter permease [[Clostridium] dakarense]
MFNIIKNTFRLLFRRPSLICGLIIIPAVVTMAFSYILGSEVKFSVGLINKDNGIVSNTIIEELKKEDNFVIKELKEDEVDSAVVGKEVELALVFEKDFSNNILAGNLDSVKIKSIGESEVKATIETLLSQEVSTLKTFGLIAKGDKNKFEDLLKDYDNSKIDYKLNKVNESKTNVYASAGIQIMVLMTSAFYITRFVIDDEKSGTKDRVLLGNISKGNYYFGVLIPFFICSAISSIFYFLLCTLLGFDFVTDTPIYFLYVLFAINFLAIGFNLFIISFSKTPQVAANFSSIFVTAGSMLSGLFWPFSLMPEPVQKIGNLIPLRWAGIAFEKIQEGASLGDISIYLFGIVFAGLICLLLTVIISGKKKSVRV